MKNKKVKLIVFIILIFGIAFIGFNIYKSHIKSGGDTSVNEASKPSADLSFAVLGDVHDNISNFKDAINDFYKINPHMDALVLNGDTVDQGKDEQYDEIKKVISKNSGKLPDTIIKNLGNHEFYNYDEDSNSQEAIEDFTHKYLEFSGTEKVYHDTWLKGYHFISLGSDNITSGDLGSTQASLSDEQLSWLRETLKENYVEGKPIFVFLHQPISINFFGGQWYGVKQGDKLKEILNDYPEVFIFSSHTHKQFNDDYIQENMPYTMVHTGAVGYTFIEDADSENGRERDSSANNVLYVEVNGNEVTLNGRDVKNHRWVYTKHL